MNHDKPLFWICLPVVHRLKLASPPVYQMAFIRFVSKPLVRWLSLASSCVVIAVINRKNSTRDACTSNGASSLPFPHVLLSHWHRLKIPLQSYKQNVLRSGQNFRGQPSSTHCDHRKRVRMSLVDSLLH